MMLFNNIFAHLEIHLYHNGLIPAACMCVTSEAHFMCNKPCSQTLKKKNASVEGGKMCGN